MNNKLSLSEIAALLAERTGRDRKTAESFLRELIVVVSEGLDADKMVKIKGLGTFKIIPVEQRESVHVHTGERFVIPAHYKYSFLPDKELRDTVNAPFSFFETTEIGPGVDFSDLEESVEEEPNAEEESVEEVLPETGLPDDLVENEEPAAHRLRENPGNDVATDIFSPFSEAAPEEKSDENGFSDDRLPGSVERQSEHIQQSVADPDQPDFRNREPSGPDEAGRDFVEEPLAGCIEPDSSRLPGRPAEPVAPLRRDGCDRDGEAVGAPDAADDEPANGAGTEKADRPDGYSGAGTRTDDLSAAFDPDAARLPGTEPEPTHPEAPEHFSDEAAAEAGAFDPDDFLFPEPTPEPLSEPVAETSRTDAGDRRPHKDIFRQETAPESPAADSPVSGKTPVYKRDWFIAACILCVFIGLSAGLYRWYSRRPLQLVVTAERKTAAPEAIPRQSDAFRTENGNRTDLPAGPVAAGDSLAGNEVPERPQETGDSVALLAAARDLPDAPSDSAGQTSPTAAATPGTKPGEPATPRWIGQATIAPGDRLTLIALKHYGHKFFWVYIYTANKDVIRDPNNIPIGTVLKLPAPETYGIDARSRESVSRAAALQTRILQGKES